MIGIFGRSRVEMQDCCGVDDQYTRTIALKPEMDAIRGEIPCRLLLLVDPRRDGFDL
jgi:hypothetical protein